MPSNVIWKSTDLNSDVIIVDIIGMGESTTVRYFKGFSVFHWHQELDKLNYTSLYYYIMNFLVIIHSINTHQVSMSCCLNMFLRESCCMRKLAMILEATRMSVLQYVKFTCLNEQECVKLFHSCLYIAILYNYRNYYPKPPLKPPPFPANSGIQKRILRCLKTRLSHLYLFAPISSSPLKTSTG